MKNLIYQYWDGIIPVGCKAGQENMNKYAGRIGADYLFEDNPKFVTNLGRYSVFYGWLKPVYENFFRDYDNVLCVDTDIFAVNGLEENIFENFTSDMGICTEPFQPAYRAKATGKICGAMDEKWASIVKSHWQVEMPRTPEGLLKVYNSGLVMFSNEGLLKAKEKFVPFKKYIKIMRSKGMRGIYTNDQNYVHAMLKVADMDYVELDNGWNSYIHYFEDHDTQTRAINDMRSKSTKFVHIQLSGADDYDADKLWRITNLPITEWDIEKT